MKTDAVTSVTIWLGIVMISITCADLFEIDAEFAMLSNDPQPPLAPAINRLINRQVGAINKPPVFEIERELPDSAKPIATSDFLHSDTTATDSNGPRFITNTPTKRARPGLSTQRQLFHGRENSHNTQENFADQDKRGITITGKAKSTETATSNAPALSTSQPALSSSAPPMPTLTSSTTSSIATPTVIVPDMSNNPFLTQSNLPEGTVFIAVGAILGAIALAIVAWRVLTTFALRRSMRNSYGAFGASEQKAPLFDTDGTKSNTAGRLSGRYSLVGLGGGGAGHGRPESLSSSHLNLGGSAGRPGGNGGAASGAASMFFSPTAEVMNTANTGSLHGTGGGESISSSSVGGAGGHAHTGSMHHQRSSVYLPAGYYGGLSGVPTPGGGAASISSRNTRNVSMSRESMYYNNNSISNNTHSRYSTIQSGTEPQGQRPQSEYTVRAPSAFLEDMLDD